MCLLKGISSLISPRVLIGNSTDLQEPHCCWICRFVPSYTSSWERLTGKKTHLQLAGAPYCNNPVWDPPQVESFGIILLKRYHVHQLHLDEVTSSQSEVCKTSDSMKGENQALGKGDWKSERDIEMSYYLTGTCIPKNYTTFTNHYLPSDSKWPSLDRESAAKRSSLLTQNHRTNVRSWLDLITF